MQGTNHYLKVVTFFIGALVVVAYLAMEVQNYWNRHLYPLKNNNQWLNKAPVGNFKDK